MPHDKRLAQLLSLAGGSPSNSERWDSIETELGIPLPPQYKLIVDTFDDLSFGDFIHVLSPFSDAYDFIRSINDTLDADRTSRHQFPSHYPFALYPETDGLFPWAITDNGDNLYWITQSDAARWPTLIRGPRAPEFEVSFLPPNLLIHHIAAGSFRSTILPTL